MSNMQETATEEKKTFAQVLEKLEELEDTILVKSIKSWLERLQMPIDEVVGWKFTLDATDITEDGKVFKKYIAGPYRRIKLTFKDGTAKYGKSLHCCEWNIKDDIEENWGYEWVRQKKEENDL